jgi:6-phosphogluconolactonase (cycloisomerase 2 family)
VLAQTSQNMEMMARMSKRLWLLGVVGLVMVGFLVACGSNYNSSQDGLLLVGSQGSGLIETFSFTLSNGHVSAIANSPNDTANSVCVLHGLPSSIVMHPAGVYAYAIINKNQTACGASSVDGIATFKVSSDGNITQVGGLTSDPSPVTLTMDPSGKFLFVAEGAGLVNSYAIGSGGSLTVVPGTFTFNNGMGFQAPNIVAVAPSPTIFPGIGINGTQNSVCSVPGNPPPTSEFLYAVDSTNYVVWEFAVDTSTGALGNPPNASAVSSFPTDKIPAGVAVDPCDRFVYVSDSLTNKISAYTICTAVQFPGPCPYADGSLVQVAGSPFSLSGNANSPGPILVDPYGNNVYVVGTLSNTVSPLKISPLSGALTALTPPVVATGLQPTAIAIRGDDNWMFVSNYNSQTVSQFSITPATGALSAAPPIQTDNYPWGVAVK